MQLLYHLQEQQFKEGIKVRHGVTIVVLANLDTLRSPPSAGNRFHPQRAYATIVKEDLQLSRRLFQKRRIIVHKCPGCRDE